MRVLFAAIALGMAFCAPAKATDAYNWSGLYLGAHAGYAWGNAMTRDDPADWGNDPKFIGPFPYDLNGGFGGGTVGYNFQAGSFVVGPEADLGFMDLSGSRTSESSNPIYHQDHSVEGGLYALLGGRAGFAFGRTLIYGKGGWVFIDGNQEQTTTKPGFVTHDSGSFDGWAYGGGIEQALGQGWSLKGEYLHFNLDGVSADQTSVTDDPIGHVYHNWTDFGGIDTVKVGINYRWGEREQIIPLK